MSDNEGITTFKINIREACDNDVDKMHRLERMCFDIEAFNKRQFKYLINSKTAFSFVAEMDGEFTGFIIGLTIRNHYGKYGRLYSLNVDPHFRQRGIATTLMKEMIERMRKAGYSKCFLEVKLDNLLAIPLYEYYGFKRLHIIPNYYKNGEPALKMVKNF